MNAETCLIFEIEVGYRHQVKGSIDFNLLSFGTICNLKNGKKKKNKIETIKRQ